MGRTRCVCGRDAFREKGLLAPKQASWANHAAAKLPKAPGVKVCLKQTELYHGQKERL